MASVPHSANIGTTPSVTYPQISGAYRGFSAMGQHQNRKLGQVGDRSPIGVVTPAVPRDSVLNSPHQAGIELRQHGRGIRLEPARSGHLRCTNSLYYPYRRAGRDRGRLGRRVPVARGAGSSRPLECQNASPPPVQIASEDAARRGMSSSRTVQKFLSTSAKDAHSLGSEDLGWARTTTVLYRASRRSWPPSIHMEPPSGAHRTASACWIDLTACVQNCDRN